MSYAQLQNHFTGNKNNEDFIRVSTELDGIKKQLQDKELHVTDLRKQVEEKNQELVQKKSELDKLHGDYESTNKINSNLNTKLAEHEASKRELEERLSNLNNEKANLKSSIDDKLKTLSKIDRTFFGMAGNKGKGMLGEMQLENLLIQSGLEQDFWMKNLQVGSKNVEFAIKSGETDKWIPVDSKVLDTLEDEDHNIIIDENYIKKIGEQAKKIVQYLGKANTANYGLLVLQNDEIYMAVHKFDPHFFQRVIKKHKIYVASPSSFIQFAWSISHILEIYEKVHGEEVIYNRIIAMMNSTGTLVKSLHNSFASMSQAMMTHYPRLKKHHDKVYKAFEKSDSIKQKLPNLGETKAELKAIKSIEE